MSMDNFVKEFKPVALEKHEIEKGQNKYNICNFSHYLPSKFVFKEKTRGLFNLRAIYKFETINYYLDGKVKAVVFENDKFKY